MSRRMRSVGVPPAPTACSTSRCDGRVHGEGVLQRQTLLPFALKELLQGDDPRSLGFWGARKGPAGGDQTRKSPRRHRPNRPSSDGSRGVMTHGSPSASQYSTGSNVQRLRPEESPGGATAEVHFSREVDLLGPLSIISVRADGPLTQSVEYLPFKERVTGSSPVRPTTGVPIV